MLWGLVRYLLFGGLSFEESYEKLAFWWTVCCGVLGPWSGLEECFLVDCLLWGIGAVVRSRGMLFGGLSVVGYWGRGQV